MVYFISSERTVDDLLELPDVMYNEFVTTSRLVIVRMNEKTSPLFLLGGVFD